MAPVKYPAAGGRLPFVRECWPLPLYTFHLQVIVGHCFRSVSHIIPFARECWPGPWYYTHLHGHVLLSSSYSQKMLASALVQYVKCHALQAVRLPVVDLHGIVHFPHTHAVTYYDQPRPICKGMLDSTLVNYGCSFTVCICKRMLAYALCEWSECFCSCFVLSISLVSIVCHSIHCSGILVLDSCYSQQLLHPICEWSERFGLYCPFPLF